MDHPTVPAATKQQLRDQYANLNPAQLRRQIDEILVQLAVAYETKSSPAEIPLAQSVESDFMLAEQGVVRLGVMVT
ncbi:MAG: hypothetical protein WC654_07415 [Patescibacteria group bacterium]